MPRRRLRLRLRLHVRQRLLLVEDVVGRPGRAGGLIRVLVRKHGGGSEVARIPDGCQVIFGVDQTRCGGASLGRLRNFAGPLPRCVIRLTGHACQGKGIYA